LRVRTVVFFRWFRANDVQVAGRGRASHRQLAMVDGVRRLHDGRTFALALDDRQQSDGDPPADDQVAQD